MKKKNQQIDKNLSHEHLSEESKQLFSKRGVRLQDNQVSKKFDNNSI